MTQSVVMKFGGSSVATIERIKVVATIIKKRREKTTNIVVVVSAMGKHTNEMIQQAQSISETPSKREMDVLLATGEQTTIALLSMALIEMGVDATSLTGWQVGLQTYGNHMKSRIDTIKSDRLKEELNQGRVVIVAGFQGVDALGDITTLGRGGSDTSAVALACALDYPVEIYTDVDGIYTVDPRLYKNARKLKTLSYEETMEMANLGAKIIEPRSVELASRYQIPIGIYLNTANVEGTIIKEHDNMMEESTITNVSVMGDVVLINIEDISKQDINVADLFIQLAEMGISVDVISQTYKEDLSFTIMKDDIAHAMKLLSSMKIEHYYIKDDVIKVSIIGNAMRNQPGVAAKVFKVFNEEDINFYQVSTSEISISYIVDELYKEKIVSALVVAFDL